MKYRKVHAFLFLLLLTPVLLLFMGATGCETLTGASDDDRDYDHRDYDHRDYDRHDRDWDRHDYDRDHDRDHDSPRVEEIRVYDYYPLREVYYNRHTREYTYWDNDKLERRSSLPDYIRDSMGREHYEVRLKGNEPERYHDRIKRQYPGGGRGGDWDRDREDRRDRDRDIPSGARVYGPREDAKAYDFYPERGVFFNLESGEYTWQNNGRWEQANRLPDFIRDSMGNRHERVYIAGENPQGYYERVQRDYPR